MRRFPPPQTLLLAATLAAMATAAPAAAEVRIAVVAPSSGAFAPFGDAIRAGVAAGAAAIGDVEGEPIVVEEAEDACDAERATATANRLVGRGVRLVVGHFCSLASLAAANVYAEAGIVLITPSAAGAKVTDARPAPLVFRIAPRIDAAGRFLGAFLGRSYRNAAVAFVGDGSTYGKGLVDGALPAFRSRGGKPVLIETFQPGERSFETLAAKLAGEGIDVLFIGGYQADAAQIVADLAAVGERPTIVGGDALMVDDYLGLAGEAAEGTVFAAPADLIGAGDAAGFAGYARRAQAAVEVWAAAAGEAGSLAGPDVAAEIAAGAFDTVLGEVSFDAAGDADLPGYALYQWRGGRIAALR